MTRQNTYAFCTFASALALLAVPSQHANAQSTINIRIDATQGRHPISPLIYGVNMGTKDQLASLNASANRFGGNNTSSYNWKVNSSNNANDWFFETQPGQNWLAPPGQNLTPAGRPDQFFTDDKAEGAATLMTISTIGWVGKVVDPKTTLSSYSVAKYGPQQKTDPNLPDAGNGKHLDGSRITSNDPNDANVPSDVDFQSGFVQHLVKKFGRASKGGVNVYLMDNEPGIWQETHQDVHPNGATSKEIADDIIAYGTMVKSIDPSAQVAGPEEWGYTALANSGADKQYGDAHGWPADLPDKTTRGGMDNMAWILDQIHKHDLATGKRTLDYLTIHVYPQAAGGSGTDDTSDQKRSESTRQLWDPSYVDGSWIKDKIMMIPRLKALVAQYYPGTKIGITEYNWGAENDISGATTQADILGIFGREGLDLGTRWTTPGVDSVSFKAIQMYRNYDGHKSVFGDLSISDIPDSNPDNLSSFAAIRKSDGALTIMVVNKQNHGDQPVSISLNGFSEVSADSASAYQLTSSNQITKLPDVTISGSAINASVPAQSVTLYIIPGASKP
jgi:hypothetical protein